MALPGYVRARTAGGARTAAVRAPPSASADDGRDGVPDEFDRHLGETRAGGCAAMPRIGSVGPGCRGGTRRRTDRRRDISGSGEVDDPGTSALPLPGALR